MSDKAKSEQNRPPYFKWLIKKQKPTALLSVIGIIACFFATPEIFSAENDVPVAIMIMAIVAIYGFTIGMMLQPFFIYKNLIETNYWSDRTPWSKNW